MVGGTGVGVGTIILIFILGLPSHYEHLKTANIISASWGFDSLKPGQVMPSQEVLPLCTQDSKGLPVYAYLHPETPPSQLLADKNARPARHLKKRRLKKRVCRRHAYKAKAKAKARRSKRHKSSAKSLARKHKSKKKAHSSSSRARKHKSKKKAHSSSKKMAAVSR